MRRAPRSRCGCRLTQGVRRLASLEDHSGSTAITAFVTPTHFVIGNVGDSRAVLARGGLPFFGTEDHKPTDAGEMARITGSGGYVEMGRVCGNLAVSRALGDYQYKDRPDLPAEAQKVTVDPDITVIERTEEDQARAHPTRGTRAAAAHPRSAQFLLLCCDGIWDVMTNEECVTFVADHLKGGWSVPVICERLIDHCLHKNSRDNMSACIVLLPNAPEPVAGFEMPKYDVGTQGGADHDAADAEFSRRLSTKK